MSRDADALDRRTFVGATAAAAAAMFIKPELVHGTRANSAVRVGLLGCGGRGPKDGPNLVAPGAPRALALPELFPNHLDPPDALFLKGQQAKGFRRVDPKPEFVG